MKLKKNPKADLNKDSGLFFVIGLTLVLLITWRALEYKSYDTSLSDVVIAHMVDPDFKEDIPITETLKLPPPPPPIAPTIIEVIEDAEEIEETFIQSTETNQEAEINAPILSVDDINTDEGEEELTIPFAVIEDVPVFPGCENVPKAEKRACFEQKIQAHVVKNFKYPEISVEMGMQGKVYVQFIINVDGNITNIKSRGPDQLLEKEAERIIATLPQMTPGKQRGMPVKVPFSIPVTFKLL
jgi:protein TonB